MDDQSLRLRIYDTLARTGRAPSAVALAGAFGVPPVEVHAALRRLEHDHHALLLVPSTHSIWMANPFSGVATDFAVTADDGRSWYANCIWDAVAIPPLVRAPATVRTGCPECGDDLTVRVDGDGVEAGGAVAHVAVPARAWYVDIGHT